MASGRESGSAAPATSIRRPGGRPRSSPLVGPRARNLSAGSAYCEIRAHLATGEIGAATPAASSPVWWAATRNFRIPPSSVYVVGTCRQLGAYREVRAHSAPSEPGAATPTALRARPTDWRKAVLKPGEPFGQDIHRRRRRACDWQAAKGVQCLRFFDIIRVL
jgi:hypothetical protein